MVFLHTFDHIFWLFKAIWTLILKVGLAEIPVCLTTITTRRHAATLTVVLPAWQPRAVAGIDDVVVSTGRMTTR